MAKNIKYGECQVCEFCFTSDNLKQIESEPVGNHQLKVMCPICGNRQIIIVPQLISNPQNTIRQEGPGAGGGTSKKNSYTSYSNRNDAINNTETSYRHKTNPAIPVLIAVLFIVVFAVTFLIFNSLNRNGGTFHASNLKNPFSIFSSEKNIKEDVTAIDTEYEDILEKIDDGTYEKKEYSNGLETYSGDGGIKAISMPKMYSGYKYKESYYYKGGELIYAIFDDKERNGFYFKDGNLIRWKCGSENYDLDTSKNYKLWENLVKKASERHIDYAQSNEPIQDTYETWKSLADGVVKYLGDNSSSNSSDYDSSSDSSNSSSSSSSSSSGEYILPNSDSTYLDNSDLSGLSARECRLARNEIYARHGRKFNDSSLQEYFDSQDWYTPKISATDWENRGDDSFLNKYELKNRKLIESYEYDQGYRY